MKKIFTFLILLFLVLQIDLVKGENIYIVRNTNPSGENSFLWAITEANKEGGIIKFDIPKEDKNFDGRGWTIYLRDNLPIIERKITIDGLSQNEKHPYLDKNMPLVTIDASLLTSDSLFTFKYEFEISGLNLTNFKNKDYIRIETTKGTIKNISIDNGDTGIHLFKSSNIRILNSSLRNLNYGIYLYYSNNNLIDGVSVENCTFGIRFYYSSSDEIRNSIFNNNQTAIRVFYNSIRNKIYKNTFTKNEDGIFLRDSFNEKNEIFENTFLENFNGVHLYYGTKTIINKNEFLKNYVGINIEFFSSDNFIQNNFFKENDFGVKFFNSCEKNLIIENSFEKNKKGIFFDDISNKNNSFSRNIFVNNDENIILKGANNKVATPRILFAKVFGKSILISVKSENFGLVEVFSSDELGKNALKFLGEKKLQREEEIFYILTDETLLGKHVLITFTDASQNTSEFEKIFVEGKAPFLDLILKRLTPSERGKNVEFLSEIRNYGDEDIEGVIFKIEIPKEFKDLKILSNPKGSNSRIVDNQIFIENIKVGKNSISSIKFSFFIGDNVKINSKFSLQGEIEYNLYGKIKIVEKSDENGLDDGYPGSSILDEATEFTVTGKPQIIIESQQNLNVNSNSNFVLSLLVKNVGNYPDKKVNIKISIPNSLEYLSSNIGQFKRDESFYYLILDSIKEGEFIKIDLELKAKESIFDKKDSITFLYKSDVNEIKRDINVFIKGEGIESLSMRVEGEKEIYSNSNLSFEIFIKNIGTKEALNKLIRIKVPNNFILLDNYDLKGGFIEIKIDKIKINEEIKIKLSFKSISPCDTISSFEFYLDNITNKKDILTKCLKIFHNPIISGYPDGTFRPDNPIKRVEVASILSNTFLLSRSDSGTLPRDVKETHWGKDFILNVISSGLMSGYKDGSFKPDEPLKRSEAAAIIFKILSLNEDYGDYFKDISDKYWAKGIIGAVYRSGIISGYQDKTFKGEKNVTRAEFVVMLLKALGREGNLGELNKFRDVNKNHWSYKYILEATTPHILINPQKLKEIRIGTKTIPLFIEKENSYIKILKSGDKIIASIPFLYEDLRELEIEILDTTFRIH